MLDAPFLQHVTKGAQDEGSAAAVIQGLLDHLEVEMNYMPWTAFWQTVETLAGRATADGLSFLLGVARHEAALYDNLLSWLESCRSFRWQPKYDTAEAEVHHRFVQVASALAERASYMLGVVSRLEGHYRRIK